MGAVGEQLLHSKRKDCSQIQSHQIKLPHCYCTTSGETERFEGCLVNVNTSHVSCGRQVPMLAVQSLRAAVQR